MKITAIKQQEKRKDRYSIFIDGKYSFSLSEAALLEQKLASGQELDEQQIKAFQKLSVDDKAYGNALRYAAMRLRSEWELAEYLRRKQVDQVASERIINKLRDVGLLDDGRFAVAWVENRRLLKPTSKRRLRQELLQKRVAESIIQKALGDDQNDELQTLHDLIRKKTKQVKYQNDQFKLMQYLARQGFSYDDIKSELDAPD